MKSRYLDPGFIDGADAVVLPGVGAWRRDGGIDRFGIDTIMRAIEKGKPFLGFALVCSFSSKAARREMQK